MSKDFSLNSSYYGLWNNLSLKYPKILHPIAQRLNYFNEKNITNINGKKESKYPFIIKLCGDSTNVGKTFKCLNFNFCVINDKQRCKTAKGNYTIGIFDILDENYDTLERTIRQIMGEIEEIKSIILENIKFDIIYKLGGDLKFLLLLFGLKAANSDHPCIVCICHKHDFATVIIFIYLSINITLKF